MKYKNAPVSEVVIGVNYKSAIFTDDDLCVINTYLSKDYPTIEILPPINIEQLVDYKLQIGFDINSSGQILYRRRTDDRNWLIQIQQNKIYMNWIRGDSSPVGNYPGYSVIVSNFFTLLDKISKLLNKDLKKNVMFYDLTYNDRFSWQDYIDDLTKINNILTISIPSIPNTVSNNIFSKYTYPIQKIDGFGIVSINTSTSPDTMKQIIGIETSLRGFGNDFQIWFNTAHDIQQHIFETLYKDSIKQKWMD